MPQYLEQTIQNLAEVLANDAQQHQPSIQPFDLAQTLQYVYRLILPKLDSQQLSLTIQTNITSPLVGDSRGLAQLLLILLHQVISVINQKKITLKVTQENHQVIFYFGGCLSAELETVMAFESVHTWCHVLGYQLNVQQKDDLLCLVLPEVTTARTVPHILIVEDNEINATVLYHFLEPYSDSIERVFNGKQAVDYVMAHEVDLVMMDINMPVMDGHQACREIRQLPCHQPSIVAVTADSTADSKRACEADGMDGFLAKPYTQQQLKTAIELALPRFF